MAFNPDAYLASKQGFDPDSYMASRKIEPPAPEAPRAWADVPMEAVKNIPSSAYHLGEGLVSHVAKNLPAIAPYAVRGPAAAVVDAGKALYNDPGMVGRFGEAAWKGLMDRYGSEEALKKTIATDPVGFALDAATIIQPGASLAARGGRAVAEIGRAADVTRPLHEIPPPPPGRPPPPPPAAPPPLEDPALMEVRAAIASQPRALTSESPTVQQTGQVMSKLPGIGGPIQQAIEAVPGRFGEARTAVADELGGYRTPQNIGEDVRATLGGAREAEQAAEALRVKQANEAAQAAHEQAVASREQAIAQREQASTQGAEQRIGNVSPTVTGDVIGDATRASHAQAEAAKNAAYDRYGAMEGSIKAEGVGSLYPAVDSEFLKSGRNLIPGVTPKAIILHDEIQNLSRGIIPDNMRGAHIPGATAGDTAISIQGLNAFRKRFNAIANSAEIGEDSAAARQMMNSFDKWENTVLEKHLASGDPAAVLAAQREANALNRDFKQRFGYNDRNDADRLLNKIVQRGDQVGPDDIFRALKQEGNKPARLIDAIHGATGGTPEVRQAISGGFYRHLTTDAQGAALPPKKAAENIGKLLNNRELSSRVWGDQERAVARQHINTLTEAAKARTEAEALAKSGKPVPVEPVKGPAQEIADRILGKGEKPAEAIFDAIEDLAKSKGGGKDLATLSKTLNALPPELQGNFLNTFVRRIGEGAKGEPFNPAKFAKEWLDDINPQAKQIMVKNGPHIKALDELAAASKNFDEVHRKFGNVTNSGNTGNFMQLAKIGAAVSAGGGAIAVIGPMKLLGGWFAGRQIAHFLATPQGAASASRFVRQMQKLQSAPTMANAAAANLAKINMRNTAVGLGISHNIPETSKR